MGTEKVVMESMVEFMWFTSYRHCGRIGRGLFNIGWTDNVIIVCVDEQVPFAVNHGKKNVADLKAAVPALLPNPIFRIRGVGILHDDLALHDHLDRKGAWGGG